MRGAATSGQAFHVYDRTQPFDQLRQASKRAQIVSIEYVADLEATIFAVDTVTPDRTLSAQEELRRVRMGLDQLPARCREVVLLSDIKHQAGKGLFQERPKTSINR